MTAAQILVVARDANVRLEAHGDRLHVEAPRGAVTAELRDALVRYKAALLELLAPIEYVALRGGLIVAVPALRLALDLEARGFRQSVDADGAYAVEPGPVLTDNDRVAIASHVAVRRVMVVGDKPVASSPNNTGSAALKSPVDNPRKYKIGRTSVTFGARRI